MAPTQLLRNLRGKFRSNRLARRDRMQKFLDDLRATGMRIGENVAIYNSTFDTNYPFLIEIGSNTIVTHATVLAHDASPMVFGRGIIVGPVSIGSCCFIGAGAVVMPGVTIGDNCIVGAHAVVTNDVPSGVVAVGNPAHAFCSTEAWLAKLESPKGSKRFIEFTLSAMVPTEAELEALVTRVRAGVKKI